jgi:arylsulfatase A-like enzyme
MRVFEMDNIVAFLRHRPSSFSAVVGLICILGVLPASTAVSAPNILVIVGDDMGVETLSCYGLNNDVAVTPTLDNLCAHGIRFDNMWSQPVCSPTRATVMTGRYGFRTGVGFAIETPPDVEKIVPEKPADANFEPPSNRLGRAPRPSVSGLSLNEFTLPMALKSDSALGYETAAIGKWHLSDQGNGYEAHPLSAGFDHFAGSAIGGLESYFAFSKQVDGVETEGSTVYSTTDKVNSALDWIQARDDEPWFMWLSFNNPHSPYHLPPVELLHSDAKYLDPDAVAENPYAYFKAQLEALDTEVGRLLTAMSEEQRENTYVIFLGDNGTSRGALQPPFHSGRGKDSVYQGGLNVPFIVTGPRIEDGRVSDALINTVDLYATFVDLAGIDVERTVPGDREFDSISFAPLLHDPQATPARDFAFADIFSPWREPSRAIRNASHKLVDIEGVEELYNLQNDPYEYDNLLAKQLSPADQENYEDLKSRLTALLASEPN